MEYSCLQLNDLPDEILLIIFKKLNNVALLYSLFDVNKRLNKILHDPIFTSHLNLLNLCSNDYIHGYLIQYLIDFVHKFYLKLIKKSNGLILNHHRWEIFFFIQIILI